MKNALLIIGAVLGVAVLLVGVVYAFGTPQAAPPPPALDPSAAGASTMGAPSGSTGSGDPMGGMGGQVDPDAVAPPPDPSTPLAIEIPGCVCHSDDPQIVAEHEQYRMNQCAGCHLGATPTGP